MKKSFRPESWNNIRGLTPFFENYGSHKEWFDMGCPLQDISDEALKMPLYEETPFPPQEEFQWIRRVFNDQYNKMLTMSLKLLEYIAIGLGKDRFFFHQWFEQDSLSTYRVNHILPRTAGIVDNSELNEEKLKLTT